MSQKEFEFEVKVWDEDEGYKTKKVKLSERELKAAIIFDSAGYASPRHAGMHVKDYKEGKKKAFCERGICAFDKNLERLIDSAVNSWDFISQETKEKYLRVLKNWERLEKEDKIASKAISLMFPTSA